jgi:hypothetical protein
MPRAEAYARALRASQKVKRPEVYMNAASLVWFIPPISKEAPPASISGRVWYDLSLRTCLAGLRVLLHTEKSILFYSCVLPQQIQV